MKIIVETILIGKVKPLAGSDHLSGMDKHAVDCPVWLGPDGIAGDEQADRKHHGGVDKALHHYPQEHYPLWQQGIDAQHPERERHVVDDIWQRPGAFGENIATTGCTEHDVCIGDIFSLGDAILEVSQSRQPCWKLNVRFGLSGMARTVQQTGRTGWYYRVRKSGWIKPGDILALQERPYRDWPLARILEVLYHHPSVDPDLLRELRAIETLPPSWHKLLDKRISAGQIEDWSARLGS